MPDAAAFAPDVFPRALGRLRVALDDAYLRASRELGLTAQQAELLCAAMHPTAISDLAQLLHCDRSNVSRLVDRAAARGLLRRRAAQEDGRVTVIELTAHGTKLAQQLLAALEDQTAALRAEWSDKRQRQAAKLLNDICAALETPTPP